MHQHLVALGAVDVHGRDDAAQHAVLVADVLFGQVLDPVAGLVPPDDGVIVLIPGGEVAEVGLLQTGSDGIGDGVEHREVHVCHPHGDDVKPFPGRVGGKAGVFAQGVQGQGVLAFAVHQGRKIILHGENLLFQSDGCQKAVQPSSVRAYIMTKPMTMKQITLGRAHLSQVG